MSQLTTTPECIEESRNNELLAKIDELIKKVDEIRAAATKRYLSKKEAAAYIDRSVNYIDNLIRSKEIPYYMPSANAVYIDRHELERYISNNRFKSMVEIERIK